MTVLKLHIDKWSWIHTVTQNLRHTTDYLTQPTELENLEETAVHYGSGYG